MTKDSQIPGPQSLDVAQSSSVIRVEGFERALKINQELNQRFKTSEMGSFLVQAHNVIAQHIGAFQRVVKAFNSAVNEWVQMNPQLLEKFREYSEAQLMFADGSLTLIDAVEKSSNAGYEVAMLTLSIIEIAEIYHPIKSASEQDVIEEIHKLAFRFTTSGKFKEELDELKNRADLPSGRTAQIDSVVTAHSREDFWAACPLALAVVEGLITEELIKLKLASRCAKRQRLTKPDGKSLSGVQAKLELLATYNGTTRVLGFLAESPMVPNDGNSKVNRLRNAILHGDNMFYGESSERSTLFMFILHAVLSEIVHIREISNVYNNEQ